jgi:hypothetical protein
MSGPDRKHASKPDMIYSFYTPKITKISMAWNFEFVTEEYYIVGFIWAQIVHKKTINLCNC